LFLSNKLENMPKIEALKNLGIKVVLRVGLWDTADWLQKVSEDPALREKLANNIMELVERFNFDGVCLWWAFPAAPQVNSSFKN